MSIDDAEGALTWKDMERVLEEASKPVKINEYLLRGIKVNYLIFVGQGAYEQIMTEPRLASYRPFAFRQGIDEIKIL